MDTEIQYGSIVDDLNLDPLNPRLGRENTGNDVSQEKVLSLMQDWTLEELAVSFVENGFWPQEADTRNKSLTEMRQVLVGSQNIMVAIGGKMHKRNGYVPGVLEEMEMAAKREIPRFLVAGMGGFAAEYAKELTPASLKNGLSDDQNALLFSTPDVGACVGVIFEQLAKQKLG